MLYYVWSVEIDCLTPSNTNREEDRMRDIVGYKVVDKDGRVIGKAVIDHNWSDGQKAAKVPPRHYDGWGEFEEENLRDAFRCFVSDRALKAGRTEGAIMSRLRRFMPGTWS